MTRRTNKKKSKKGGSGESLVVMSNNVRTGDKMDLDNLQYDTKAYNSVLQKAKRFEGKCYNECHKIKEQYIKQELPKYLLTRENMEREKKEFFASLARGNSLHSNPVPTESLSAKSRRWIGLGGKKTRKGRKRRRRRKSRRYNKKY